MAYRWARWLPEALKKEGVDVVLEPGWRNRGRYRVDGSVKRPPNWNFEPNGLFVWHHTATTTSPSRPWPTGNLLKAGRSGLPGPLCQLSPDHLGRVHVVAAGRSNHAGKFSGAGPTVRGSDGNTVSIGCEIDTNGTQKIPLKQYRASIRSAAAVNRHFKRNASWSLGHAETSVTGKWDPGESGRTVDLDAWRRDLAECLSYPPGVWYSKQGTASWGEVDLSELRKGARGEDKHSIRRMQFRLKRANKKKVPEELRKAVRVNGKWDEATRACLAAWQANVFDPGPGGEDGYQGGKRLGPRQAEKLFGPRYKLVK